MFTVLEDEWLQCLEKQIDKNYLLLVPTPAVFTLRLVFVYFAMTYDVIPICLQTTCLQGPDITIVHQPLLPPATATRLGPRSLWNWNWNWNCHSPVCTLLATTPFPGQSLQISNPLIPDADLIDCYQLSLTIMEDKGTEAIHRLTLTSCHNITNDSPMQSRGSMTSIPSFVVPPHESTNHDHVKALTT